MRPFLHFLSFCIALVAGAFIGLSIPFYSASKWLEKKGNSYRLNFNERNQL